MGRKLQSFICLVSLLPLVGCAYCQSTFDQDYGAQGGSWERHNPTEGRVGSAFSDAGSRLEAPTEAPSSSELTSPPEAYYEALSPENLPSYR